MKNTEHTLTFKNQTAIVSPFGASLRRYVVATDAGEWNVIWGYSGGAGKKGGQGDVLIPFPGRLKNATYAFAGQTYQMAKNDKDGPNAIHGFLRAELFETRGLTEKRVTFTYDITAETYRELGFPFSLRVEVTYEMSAAGLTTSYAITNIGDENAPAGAGFHPYFRAEAGSLADWSVTIPAKNFIELENYVPTGRVLPVDDTKLDFRKGRLIGRERYNDCVAHLERDANGVARATVQAADSKNRVVITMDRSFDYVVVYTGDQIPAPDQRQGFAIEPMTCAPDAFNHDGWGTQTLAPGATMKGAYTMFGEVVD